MDERLKSVCRDLLAKTSENAASWILETYPLSSQSYGEAFLLIPHRSWARKDQARLAGYFLKKVPFASSKPYEALLSVMSADLFLSILREHLPMNEDDLQLLAYNLRPVLKKAIGDSKADEAIDSFKSGRLR